MKKVCSKCEYALNCVDWFYCKKYKCQKCNKQLYKRSAGLVCKNYQCENFHKYGCGPVIKRYEGE